MSRHYSFIPSLGDTEEGGGLGSILVGVPVLVFWDLDRLGLNTVSGGSFLELLGVAVVAPRGGHSSVVGDCMADTEAWDAGGWEFGTEVGDVVLGAEAVDAGTWVTGAGVGLELSGCGGALREAAGGVVNI